jgi:hypothetical protein
MASASGRVLGAVAVALGGLPAGLALVEAEEPLWRGLAGLFLLAAPAMATMALLPNLGPMGRLLCGVVGAVVLNGLVAESMLALHVWWVPGGATAVSIISAGLWALAGSLEPPAPGSVPPGGGAGPSTTREARAAS